MSSGLIDMIPKRIDAGLASIDQFKIEYVETPKVLFDAQNRATSNKVGLWLMERKQQQIRRAIPYLNMFVILNCYFLFNESAFSLFTIFRHL